VVGDKSFALSARGVRTLACLAVATLEEVEQVEQLLQGQGGSDAIEAVSPEEAAAILGVSRPTVVRWASNGQLTDHKVGAHHRFDRAEVEKLRDARRDAAVLARDAAARARVEAVSTGTDLDVEPTPAELIAAGKALRARRSKDAASTFGAGWSRGCARCCAGGGCAGHGFVSSDNEWIDPLAGEYERHACEDLGAGDCLAFDLDGIAAASQYPDMVEKFGKQRSLDPAGTEAPLSGVHRNDIYKLDGRDGARGITWHDSKHAVVWLLGFTPNHDLKEFVRRSSTPNRKGLGGANQLMPSLDDYQDLFDERGADWQLEQTITALNAAVGHARKATGATLRVSLADVVRAEVLIVDRGGSQTLHLRFFVPPLEQGVLPSHFEWILAGAVDDADDASIAPGPFPGPPLPGSLSIQVGLI
jgi:excisionase family DNA binding protein